MGASARSTTASLDLGELPDVAVDDVGDVRLEEAAATAGVAAAHRLGVTAAQGPLHVVVAPKIRWRDPDFHAVLEYGVDEAVWALIDLALRQLRQLDCL